MKETYTAEELRSILELHGKWARSEEGGSRANLRCADLTRANLRCADLTGANLRGADLTGANLTGANLTGANLTGANLTGANLRGADLTGANLTGANLTCANLTCADLTGADLTGADLTGADLTGANLTGANLTDADLTGADLTGADLTGSKYQDIIINQIPLQIQTDKYWVLIFETHIQIGCKFYSTEQWQNFSDREILEMDGKKALKWWQNWKEPILQMAKIQSINIIKK